jgi:glycosyltransferase involved in cell wall biosynthesis
MKFLIFHYRVGKTDGVSLEIAVWKDILEKAGHKVYLCAGPGSVGADFLIQYFDYHDDPRIAALDSYAFSQNPNAFPSLEAFAKELTTCASTLKKNFDAVIEKIKPDWAIVSNIFSLGENLPAAEALAKSLLEKKVRSLFVHHDFYWEHQRCQNPINSLVAGYQEDYYPPKAPFFLHACINSLARAELYRRKKIRSFILPDSFDFSRPLQDHGAQGAKFLQKYHLSFEDLIILQATRVVPRKGIEIAIDFVTELSRPERLKLLENRGLYSGQGFDRDRHKLALVIAGYAEKQDFDYRNKLERYAQEKKINCVFLDGVVNSFGPNDRTAKEKLNLLDLYIYADLITYPSLHEGFGNQFLEAVFSRTPIAMFEYPVFKADIKPKGFEIISFGDQYETNPKTGLVNLPTGQITAAADEAVDILTDPSRYKNLTEKNFQIGQKYYSREKISRLFSQIFQ